MKPIYVYAGSFCPPTYGHLNILRKAAEIFPEVVVVCSVNPNKNGNWFTPEECCRLWQSYDLPANARITTLSDMSKSQTGFDNLVLIRGIRGKADLEENIGVAELNHNSFGINKFFYQYGDQEFADVSSSKVRVAASKLQLEELGRMVSPLVISSLLKKVLDQKNIFLVVGRPGGGKSTFLKILNQKNPRNIHLNTDDFLAELKPLLRAHFQTDDLVTLALERDEEVKQVLKKPWLEKLQQALVQMPPDSNVFVEIPYGLQENKHSYRFIGGKVLYIGCKNQKQNQARVLKRGTPEHQPFINLIPDWEESQNVAKKNNLELWLINTDGSLEQLAETACRFNQVLEQGGTWHG
jgi:pantetheine-phosphate adenylyltransferase